MQIQAEQLAYWYFRLNGFLNIPNFVVHPDTGSEQRTDVDLLGVRFPYRSELLLDPMRDDEIFRRVREKTYIVLAEVKAGVCSLNGPWTNPSRQNMQRVLRAVGALPAQEVDLASSALYQNGLYSNQLYKVSLFCLGATESSAITEAYPHVPQVLWSHTLTFIYERFRRYQRQKVSHNQWDEQGKALWNCAERSRTIEDFITQVQVTG
ncbi:MAG: hypothetical protein JO316_20600 [Abitibacteriaceae bacterium]|nr:hypothetical protein [Abditibacteriaceae bacterium]MBV9867759.1 hypothetical protein [Abditibacteriaceae bacterium]